MKRYKSTEKYDITDITRIRLSPAGYAIWKDLPYENYITDIDEMVDHRTILMIASTFGKEKVVKDLLKRGANPNIQNKSGWTALILASSYSESEEIVRILLDAGAKPNLQTIDGRSALMWACSGYRINLKKIVKILLEGGADPNIQNDIGQTALIYASESSNTENGEEIVKILLKGGADPNIQNKYGDTALIYASDKSEETVKILLEAGADPNIIGNYRLTALLYACRGALKTPPTSTEDTIKLLLYYGAKYTDADVVKCSSLSTLHKEVHREKSKEMFSKLMRKNPYLGWGTARFA